MYYLSAGEESGMSDAEWDHLSRTFYADRAKYPASEFPVLHDERFTGGSIYWLSRHEYPAECRV